MDYDFIKQVDELKASKHEFCLNISSWESYPNNTTLVWHLVKFEKEKKGEIPLKSGIYAFFIKPGIACFQDHAYLIYIGITGEDSKNQLRNRFMQYIYGIKGKKRVKLNYILKKWKNYIYFYYAEIEDDETTLDELEIQLNDAFLPPCNIKNFSAEVRDKVKVLRS